jgi:hypothetical protein
MRTTTLCAALVGLSALGAGCADDLAPFTNVPPPPDAGCTLEQGPQRYEVYFVVDVSGSMAPFLNSLAGQLQDFARSFPERDTQDNRILVDYYVVAFVNDVLWFPNNARRMTDPIAVQQAIQEAVARGADNTLLTKDLKNAESDENLLDALSQVVSSARPDGAAVLVVVATDAGFREAPETLSGGITVQTRYATLRADLEARGIQLHAFTPDELDGLTRQFRNQPSLTSLPGSAQYSLRDLQASGELIQRTLQAIAQNAACQ